MLLRCQTCGKLFWRTGKDVRRYKDHYCSRKCAAAVRKKTYTVYDNKTDLPIIVSGTAEECAAAMGIKIGSFYGVQSKSRQGKWSRWTVLKGEEER